MNRGQPSPDEFDANLPSELAALERGLKQRQPKPVMLDAEQLLRAAAEGCLEVPDRPAIRHRERRSRWMIVGASWLCGAVAGSLLTAVLSGHSPAPEPVVHRANGEKEAVAAGPVARQADEPSPSPPARFDCHFRHWTPSELVVSNGIVSLVRLPTPGQAGRPLRAGSYVRLGITPDSWPVPGSFDRSPQSADAPDVALPEPTSDSPSALDRDSLLRELLGEPPASFL